ncbi:MAG: hypothetical protein JWQ71_435 [Pedosphaera sp.]|nr:hypothetical protein [Pedosphaera sp.]
MKVRLAFCLSLVFVLIALSLRFAALGQFQEGYRIRAQTGQREFPSQQSHRGALLLYLSLPLAAASAACMLISYRKKEPAWRWLTIGLLIVYLLISFAPA